MVTILQLQKTDAQVWAKLILVKHFLKVALKMFIDDC